jgi:nucleoside-diphosphate-sugar epimerase
MKTLVKRVLVTGATGFVGRTLCRKFRSEGIDVVAVGRRESDGPWTEFLKLDLTKESVPASVLDGVWGIVHLAGLAHVNADDLDDDPYRALSVVATSRLLEAARDMGISRFIYMSSVKAMGEGNPGGLPARPMDETWPFTPQTLYGYAKREGEQLVLESEVAHPVVIRPAMVFGPGNLGNLPKMEAAILRNRFPPVPENGNRRSMIHVEDLAEFVCRALVRPIAARKAYIACHPEAVSTRQLYDALRQKLGLSPISYSVPLKVLKASAVIGSVLSWMQKRPLPFDLEVYEKLTGSAWYSPELACRELDYRPRRAVVDWILGGAE